MPLLDELDVLDLGLEGADLQLLGLHLALVALKALRVVAHLLLDLIKFLHVLVDLLGEVFDLVADGDKLLLLSIGLLDGLIDCALDGGLQFLLDVQYHLLMIVHLLSVVSLLHPVFINRLLDLGPQFSVLIDLTLAFRLLMIKFDLYLLHLLVEVGCEAKTFLALLLQHGLVL